MINVSKIKQGIVIDHIEAGRGYEMFRQLKLDQIDDAVVVLMRNIESTKMGRKDMIKIETHLDLDFTILGLIDPNITVNYIENGEKVRKTKLTLPEKVTGILRCRNPRCISTVEKIEEITFFLCNKEQKAYRCEYCDTPTTLV